ncbi:MAG: hypothetical protein C4539_05845 [Ignavibacteriales bacterium]|nr:MAG: hypothetical protein C4539_05845 [Ignavibacteriales bacterium]
MWTRKNIIFQNKIGRIMKKKKLVKSNKKLVVHVYDTRQGKDYGGMHLSFGGSFGVDGTVYREADMIIIELTDGRMLILPFASIAVETEPM